MAAAMMGLSGALREREPPVTRRLPMSDLMPLLVESIVSEPPEISTSEID